MVRMRKFLGRPWWGGERLGDFLLALGIALAAVLVCWAIAFAVPATVGIPNQFSTQSGNVPASQLDTNFTTLAGQPTTSRVQNLIGQNDAVSPTTKYGFSADSVVVLNNTTGQSAIFTNVPTTTCDTTIAGPTANGRDQAGAFGASTWLHFYYIWKSPNAAPDCIVSASTPPTGPSLPAGYTHWAYAAAVSFTTSNLVTMRSRGAWTFYGSQQVALNSGAVQAAETGVNLAGFIPPNAQTVQLLARLLATASGVNANMSADIRVLSGSAFSQLFIGQTAGGQGSQDTQTVMIPNIGASVSYSLSASADNPNFNVLVLGYKVPTSGD